jgi:hypothetical protein
MQHFTEEGEVDAKEEEAAEAEEASLHGSRSG